MNIILISIDRFALLYLKESFNEVQLGNVTLITNKISNDLKEFLTAKKIKYIVTKKLTLSDIEELNLRNSLVLSAGSPWVFSKELINKFGDNFFNVHPSPLPSMRGSVSSYVILYDIRAFQTCVHKVEAGIDTGNIAYRKNFLIPSSLKVPKAVGDFLHIKNREMIKEFLYAYFEGQLLNEKQNSFFATYNKRLSSEINGWIDWSMDVDDLDRFIRAYGDPYGGANTCISNLNVKIENIEKSKNEPARHPEEIGIVLRNFEDHVVVSVKGGSIYIKDILFNGENIIDKIISGDRFYTKSQYLEDKNHRVLFVKQSQIYDQDIEIKKLNK